MEKDEKILKKVAKLLKVYGVDDDELEKFMLDIKDAKYDEPEVEEAVEGEEEAETTEQPMEQEETTEEEVVEEQPKEESAPAEEEVAEEGEGVSEDVAPMEEQPTMEQAPQFEEQGSELEQVKAESEFEELKKTNEALASRIQALEDVISKLGVEKQEESPLGETPMANPVEAGENDAFARINAKRLG